MPRRRRCQLSGRRQPSGSQAGAAASSRSSSPTRRSSAAARARSSSSSPAGAGPARRAKPSARSPKSLRPLLPPEPMRARLRPGMLERPGGKRTSSRRLAFLSALALAAVLAPLALAARELPFVSSSYGRVGLRFELFGAFAAIAAAVTAGLELHARRGRPARELVAVVAPLLVALHYATLIGEYSRRPFDYDCYEYAARALLLGENPYAVGLNYLYPPLTAQALALAHRALAGAAGLVGAAPDPEAVWDALFYLFQCAQLGLILLLYALAARFARAAGIETARAHALVALLLLVDNPLLRTLRHGQINLWILHLSLVAVLLARRRPALAGLGLALGAHAKLYPLVLLAPLAAARRWRAIAWTAVAAAAIALAQTDLGRDSRAWRDFAEFYARVYPGEIAFRNASFHSLAWNAGQLLFGLAPEALRAPVGRAASAVSLAMAAWLGLRIASRERAGRRAPATGDGAAAERRLLASSADALAFSLLISQSVWEHHFLFALPLVIEAVATRGRERPAAVAVSAFLLLGMPTFVLFPFGSRRAAGLLALVVLTRPRRARPLSS